MEVGARAGGPFVGARGRGLPGLQTCLLLGFGVPGLSVLRRGGQELRATSGAQGPGTRGMIGGARLSTGGFLIVWELCRV